MLPLEQIRLPYLFTTDLGLSEVAVLAAALGEQLTGTP